MTTAHRPTFVPAMGGSEQGGNRRQAPSMQFSSKDMPGHLALKYRQGAQKVSKGKDDLKRDLEESERKHFSKKSADDLGSDYRDRGDRSQLKIEDDNLDADDPIESEEDFSDSSDEDDDDDTAELMLELERIKKERAEDAARKERERMEQEAKDRTEAILRGNPLMNQGGGGGGGGGNFNLKRRWDDDVVFRNQARDEPKSEKRFVNDTIRSEFHKRFLRKYIK